MAKDIDLIGVAKYRRIQPDFSAAETVAVWSRQAAGRQELMAMDIDLAAVALRELIAILPDQRLGILAKYRAKVVAKTLEQSARAMAQAGLLTAAVPLTFYKVFAKEWNATGFTSDSSDGSKEGGE
jgi:hypothetical protein